MGVREMTRGSGSVSSSGTREIVDVPPDQSYERETVGRMKSFKYFFYGEKWEVFVKLLLKADGKPWWMGFFMGADLNENTKTIIMRNPFSHDQWLAKYAGRFKGWNFEHYGKGLRLGDADGDELQYFVNGVSFIELERVHRLS